MTKISFKHHTQRLLQLSHHSNPNNTPSRTATSIMKVSQIITLTATLALQAQACARVRVDRWVADTYNHITEVKLYDNDNPVITHPAINFRTSDDENRLNMGGYTVRLQYKDRNIVPYGGVISYPGGCKFISNPAGSGFW
jgi:hypothetical protein